MEPWASGTPQRPTRVDISWDRLEDLGLAANAALASKPKLGLPLGGRCSQSHEVIVNAEMVPCKLTKSIMKIGELREPTNKSISNPSEDGLDDFESVIFVSSIINQLRFTLFVGYSSLRIHH